MSGIGNIMGDKAWMALGLSVIHFLWQGTLVGLLAAGFLRGLRHRSAEARYLVVCAAMLLCLTAFLTTFMILMNSESSPRAVEEILPATNEVALREPILSNFDFIGFAASFWFIGCVWMMLRYAAHQLGAQRLRRREVSEATESWQHTFEILKDQLGIPRAVRLLQSGLAETAMVVGWLRPVVLVPVFAFTTLTEEQLRAVIAHELAHIRRRDHWVNLIQGVVEILLFFHPAIWWLSRRIRIEREYCCDDVSVQATGSPRNLAEGLTRLEASRIAVATAYLTANGGSLMNRISRIVRTNAPNKKPNKESMNKRIQKTAGIVGVAALLSVGVCVLNAQDRAKTEKSVTSISVEDYRRAEAEIRKAVEKGEVSREDAEMRLGEMRKHIAE